MSFHCTRINAGCTIDARMGTVQSASQEVCFNSRCQIKAFHRIRCDGDTDRHSDLGFEFTDDPCHAGDGNGTYIARIWNRKFIAEQNTIDTAILIGS